MKEENQEGSSSAIASEGAARQEYPIRALVLKKAIAASDLPAGSVIQVRRGRFRRGQEPDGIYKEFDYVDRYYSKTSTTLPGCDWTWYDSELIIDPTPAQIAAERAKLGLPSQDAVPGVPEAASAEGSHKGAYPCKTCGATGPEDNRWCFLCDSAFMTPEPSLGEGVLHEVQAYCKSVIEEHDGDSTMMGQDDIGMVAVARKVLSILNGAEGK